MVDTTRSEGSWFEKNICKAGTLQNDGKKSKKSKYFPNVDSASYLTDVKTQARNLRCEGDLYKLTLYTEASHEGPYCTPRVGWRIPVPLHYSNSFLGMSDWWDPAKTSDNMN